MLVVGPNGAGKTNLLESLHVGTQGFSPRTRADAQLIRFGEGAARVALARPPCRVGESSVEVTLRARRGQAGEAERRAAPGGRAAARRARDARLHARPARRRQGRPGGAPRLLRPGARPAAARPRRDLPRSTARRSRSETPPCGGSRSGSPRARRSSRGRRVSPSSAPSSWPRAGRRSTLLAPRSRSGRASSGCRTASLAYAGEPPTAEELEARLERDLERGATGLGPHLDDVGDPCPAAATCAPTARRASSASPCSRCCSPRPTSSPSAATRRRCSCSTTCSPSSTASAGRRLPASSAGRAGGRHDDERGAAPAGRRRSSSRCARRGARAA